MVERPGSGRFAPNLVIMARAPILGTVKRRLAADIGFPAATNFYRGLLRRVLIRLGGSNWRRDHIARRTYVAATPDAASPRLFAPWRGPIIPQGPGDLGARMSRIFLRLPPGPSLIVGSDIPCLTGRRIDAAFAALKGHDVVFGPADDGGYWLVGLRRRSLARRLFHGVRWSTQYALADTMRNCTVQRVAATAVLADVDNGKAYAHQALFAARLTIPVAKSPHCRA